MTQEIIIESVKKWIECVVIGENFCPFAKREFDSNRIMYALESTGKKQVILESLLELCVKLNDDELSETALLIIPDGLNDFYQYLDLLDLAEELLVLEGYEGIFQIASFHPDYCFADSDHDDPANYTNRSPFPIFHLLKEASLEKAIASHPDPDGIPDVNISKARANGLEYMQQLFAQSKF